MTGWTTLGGDLLPWLRGQAVYLAAAGAEPELTRTLRAAGFTLARATEEPALETEAGPADEPAGPSEEPTGPSEEPAGKTEAGPSERYRAVATALRLPASAAGNLDALADSLHDLPDRWPSCRRLVLLADADRLIRTDLLSWLQLSLVLGQATGTLWQSAGLVFETVFLVPDGTFGADLPR